MHKNLEAAYSNGLVCGCLWEDASLRIAKRLIDVIVAGVTLLGMAPIMVLIAVLVRLESPGPVLFRQFRMGKGGRCFSILKFRTMDWDAEERVVDLEASNEADDGVLFRIRNDPRVTRLGRILRRYSLDELPQLINVLRGEMSLVGPRPLQLRDCGKLAAVNPLAFERRIAVLPGLTGLAQVSGRRDLSPASILDLDSQYARSCSLRLDVEILWV